MERDFINIFERVTIPLMRRFYADIPYHNIKHIENIFSHTRMCLSDINEKYPNFDWGVYLEGVLWHDAGYIPGSCTNEFIAAQLYTQNAGGDEAVVELILSTRMGNTYFRTPEQAVLHDMDHFSYLDYTDLNRDSDEIIAEVFQGTVYKKAAIIEGRILFYARLLDSGNIFVSGVLYPDANKDAIENVKADKKRLENMLKELENA